MQESIASSDDGDDDGPAGMGAPLGLPAYLRNILNTALDRLSIVVNDIDIEVEDRFPTEPSSTPRSTDASPLSLNFHIERIAIDSIASPDPRVQVGLTTSTQELSSRSGKRRMRIENICARLVSDVDNFVSMSRISRASSPETTRSEPTIQKSQSDLSVSQLSAKPTQESEAAVEQLPEPGVTREQVDPFASASVASLHEALVESLREASAEQLQEPLGERSQEVPAKSLQEVLATSQQDFLPSLPAPPSPKRENLAASVATIDDDRFADASSDDGLVEDDQPPQSQSQSRHSPSIHGMTGSSILYDDDDGILDYAIQHDMFDSNFEDESDAPIATGHTRSWNLGGASSAHESQISNPMSEGSISALPTASALGRSFPIDDSKNSPSHSQMSAQLQRSFHESDTVQETIDEGPQSLASSTYSTASPPTQEQDLSESSVFSHDDAESMYMSAVSATPADSSRPHVPGGWDLSPTSSRDAASDTSDTSGSIPEEMVSGSILRPTPEFEDGNETPRPGSRQSTSSSPHATQPRTPTAHTHAAQRQAKVFLTIDEVTVWFPLGLNEEESVDQNDDTTPVASTLDFKPPSLVDDSIFAEMPGSFSNYAHSTSTRRSTLMEESIRKRSSSRQAHIEKPVAQPKKTSSPSISIEVGSVIGHMDVPTGRIMFGMLNRTVAALSNGASQDRKAANTDSSVRVSTSSIEITAKNVGIAWLENILAESVQDERLSRTLDPNPSEAILRINLSSLRATSQTGSQGLRSKLHIGKFVLSSLGSDIISFRTPKPNSRRSTLR